MEARYPDNPELVAERQHWARQCVDFVREVVGLPVVEVTDAVDGFLPHVRVKGGGLQVDVAQCYPGDVLHEAGHVALIPAQFRPLAEGGLEAVNEAMAEFLKAHPDGLLSWPENPVCRAVMQVSECEATAWQYAAAVEVGLPMTWLFPPGSYENEGDTELLRLRHNRHMGINGLQAAQWTQVRHNPHRPLPVYPQLAQWLSPV